MASTLTAGRGPTCDHHAVTAWRSETTYPSRPLTACSCSRESCEVGRFDVAVNEPWVARRPPPIQPHRARKAVEVDGVPRYRLKNKARSRKPPGWGVAKVHSYPFLKTQARPSTATVIVVPLHVPVLRPKVPISVTVSPPTMNVPVPLDVEFTTVEAHFVGFDTHTE